ncbi:MAG TPA: stability determinant [Pusillimonas sp.]
MSAAFSSIVSEFQSEEQAISYDRWFRAKVQGGRSDSGMDTPHDEAMALMRQKLTNKLAEQEKSATRPAKR